MLLFLGVFASFDILDCGTYWQEYGIYFIMYLVFSVSSVARNRKQKKETENDIV
jgi:hypothetical protein